MFGTFCWGMAILASNFSLPTGKNRVALSVHTGGDIQLWHLKLGHVSRMSGRFWDSSFRGKPVRPHLRWREISQGICADIEDKGRSWEQRSWFDERNTETNGIIIGLLQKWWVSRVPDNRSSEVLERRLSKSQITERYCPQQNGLIDRLNGTIVEKTRCKLIGAGLTSRLWHLAIQYVATVYNSCPHSPLNGKCSEELWGRVPNVVQFQNFGSVYYVFESKELLNKPENWTAFEVKSQDGGRRKNLWDEETSTPNRCSGRQSQSYAKESSWTWL